MQLLRWWWQFNFYNICFVFLIWIKHISSLKFLFSINTEQESIVLTTSVANWLWIGQGTKHGTVMNSLNCLWMPHAVYKDVKQNWLSLAALPMGAAPWRVLDLISGFLLIITGERQSSLNTQVTAKENLSGYEERAVRAAVTFICFPHSLVSAQPAWSEHRFPPSFRAWEHSRGQTLLALRSLWPWDTSSWGGSPVWLLQLCTTRCLQARTSTGPAQPHTLCTHLAEGLC